VFLPGKLFLSKARVYPSEASFIYKLGSSSS
jgi:hypothetical protein